MVDQVGFEPTHLGTTSKILLDASFEPVHRPSFICGGTFTLFLSLAHNNGGA